MGKGPERDRDQHHSQNRDRPAFPTLFTFIGLAHGFDTVFPNSQRLNLFAKSKSAFRPFLFLAQVSAGIPKEEQH